MLCPWNKADAGLMSGLLVLVVSILDLASTIGGIITGGFNVFGNVVFLSFTRSKGAHIAAGVYR
jgi:hypothetical protein